MDETNEMKYSPPHSTPIENSIQVNKNGLGVNFWRNCSLCRFSAWVRKPRNSKKHLKIRMKSAWGSDDPTRASFPFVHALALAEAGHDVQIFLLGEATYVMRKATARAIVPVGWPPLTETLQKLVDKHIPIFA
jgi:hypothetical protein